MTRAKIADTAIGYGESFCCITSSDAPFQVYLNRWRDPRRDKLGNIIFENGVIVVGHPQFTPNPEEPRSGIYGTPGNPYVYMQPGLKITPKGKWGHLHGTGGGFPLHGLLDVLNSDPVAIEAARDEQSKRG